MLRFLAKLFVMLPAPQSLPSYAKCEFTFQSGAVGLAKWLVKLKCLRFSTYQGNDDGEVWIQPHGVK